jgi:hypothetical protein
MRGMQNNLGKLLIAEECLFAEPKLTLMEI